MITDTLRNGRRVVRFVPRPPNLTAETKRNHAFYRRPQKASLVYRAWERWCEATDPVIDGLDRAVHSLMFWRVALWIIGAMLLLGALDAIRTGNG